ncbi:MAG: NAD-dependent dehydratase [Rhodopirellula sp.]|nr:NAD-dependent dehydratase [Rhodopirellula sp.]|tara:strand:+ start:13288 stop:14283 length:996 start_codon:yes stop_codon:yes gene_type:complete
MNLKNKRIMVIGGAGLIGSHVVDELLNTDVSEILIYDNMFRGAIDNIKDALKDPRVKINPHGGDILHEDILDRAMQGVDGVIHLAALWLLHCHEYPQSAFDVNIRGTYNVIEACRKHNIEKLVYSSSASVYGDAIQEPMAENHPYNNWTFYGATKIAGEHMIKAYHKRYDLNGIGLRYMNVYGPRQDYKGAYIAVMMKILDCIDSGERPKVFGDGSQAYDFIHVKDVAKANICALQADCSYGMYNVGRGIKTSIKDLAELLLKLSGSKLEIQYEPSGQTFVTNRVGCPKAAEKDIGFKWSIDLEDGMQSLIDWRNNHKDLVIRSQQAVSQS